VGPALVLSDKHHEPPAPPRNPDPVIEMNLRDDEERDARVLPQVEASMAENNNQTAPAPPFELPDEEEAARLDAPNEQIRSYAEKLLWARSQPPAIDDLVLERDLPNADVVGESWAVYLGCMVWTFFAPGQVIDHDSMRTAFSDTCLVCGGDTRPDMTVTERTTTRGYYKCRFQHPSGELPAWWTDWESSEVVDRQVIFTPDLAGGGNTWSTVPLGRKWGDDVTDLLWELRPTEEAQ
jgi:hypothetical protein